MTCKHEKYLQEEDRRRIRNDSERFLARDKWDDLMESEGFVKTHDGPAFEELTKQDQENLTHEALRGPEVD